MANTDITPPTPPSNELKIYAAEDDYAYVRKSDITVPRLAILQSTSPETKIRGLNLREGDWIIKDTQRLVAEYAKEQEVKLTPLFMFMSWIEWNTNRDCPRNEMILNSSFDVESELAKAAERFEKVQTLKGPKVRVTEAYNFIVAINNDYDDTAIISFQRASHKVGKALVNRCYKQKQANGRQAPMCFNGYVFSTEYIDEGAEKKYYSPILQGGIATPVDKIDDLVERAREFKSQREAIQARAVERELEENAGHTAGADEAAARGI